MNHFVLSLFAVLVSVNAFATDAVDMKAAQKLEQVLRSSVADLSKTKNQETPQLRWVIKSSNESACGDQGSYIAAELQSMKIAKEALAEGPGVRHVVSYEILNTYSVKIDDALRLNASDLKEKIESANECLF